MATSAPPCTALLIVDMVNLFDFEDGASLARSAGIAARSIRRLRDRFDARMSPVIYANDNFTHWQGEFRDLAAQCSITPGPPAEIMRLLAPTAGHHYILKPKHSAFLGTALPVLLAKLGVQRLVVTGAAADSCVLATALDANMREYPVWVPADAVASMSSARKQRCLRVLADSIKAKIQSTRSVRGLFPD